MTSLLHRDCVNKNMGGTMVVGRVLPLLLTFLIMTFPPASRADDCASSSKTAVHLSANSRRNMTGHWITEATLTRTSSRGVTSVRSEEMPWQYELNVARQSCGDAETLATSFSIVAPPPRVGPDYAFFPNVGFYKLHTEKAKWEEAVMACTKEGAHLAIVNSEAENKAIQEVMNRHSSKPFHAFIGFHDMFQEGEYRTIFGDLLSSTGYVNWGPGKPNNVIIPSVPEGEDCGCIYSADGTFNDGYCTSGLPFVCEQSI